MRFPPLEREEVMKGVPIRTLLSELEKRRFTGYCAMPIAGASAFLVLDEGRYVLAEYRGIRGRDALESIRSIGNPAVDVVIAPSSKEQLAGMVRLNEPFLVDPPRPPISHGAGLPASTTVIRPVSIGGGPGKQVKVIAVQAKKKEIPASPPGVAGKKPAAAGRPAATGSSQAERLDRKGLDHIKSMKDSFKNDAADLLSDLNLGHLVSNRPKSDKAKESEEGENRSTG